ncbi:nuclear transport factor 2 family protein [Henriciella aquimarina]|uniref:nuclear transport factor 2 family protein n=1 Tax=Henriciella aquimarina TaxID=545261 RepID=UPI001F37C56A|nr:nuclear transport factor 2 family protein [Henriciella aquimarina]
MMSPMDLERFNADWLQAWSDKDVDRLVGFYSADTVYKDPQMPRGIEGRDALRTYLDTLFASTPPMHYQPETVWKIEGGFCGRWYCDLGKDGKDGKVRGFDLVLLEHDLIKHNEVYVHPLTTGT